MVKDNRSSSACKCRQCYCLSRGRRTMVRHMYVLTKDACSHLTRFNFDTIPMAN